MSHATRRRRFRADECICAPRVLCIASGPGKAPEDLAVSKMLLLIGLGFLALLNAAPPDAAWRTGFTSPRIAALTAQVEKGDARAVDRFWQEIKAHGAP